MRSGTGSDVRSTAGGCGTRPRIALDRPALRAVLRFFSAFACDALFDALRSEPRRERRRWLLLMLETHGAPARAAARDRLAKPVDTGLGAEEWYFRRNLLHLLRRIPRSTPRGCRATRWPSPCVTRAWGFRRSS